MTNVYTNRLSPRLMAMVEKAKGAYSGPESDEAEEVVDVLDEEVDPDAEHDVTGIWPDRETRRNYAILSYEEHGLGKVPAIDVARAVIDFLEQVDTYGNYDLKRFVDVVGLYLEGAPEGTSERLGDSLLKLHEAVAKATIWIEVEALLKQTQ